MTDGFLYRIQALDGEGENLQKIVFCGKDSLPADISAVWDDGENVDAADKGLVKAFYDSDTQTVYVASSDGEKIETNKSAGNMFSGLTSLKTIEGLDFVDTARAENMASMFSFCSSLTSLDLTTFNTSKVTSMSYMFEDCSGLTSLDVSSFDTANVSNMAGMFDGCSGLKSLDVTGFDTSNVGSMWYTFAFCSSLTELDVSGFDTGSVTEMGFMFYECSSLTELDVTGFDTSSATWMGSMFGRCSSLKQLDLSTWDTTYVDCMGNMFENCTSLEKLDLTGLETGAVTDMSNMFMECSVLEKLDLSSFDTGNVKTMSSMFSGCSSLKKLYLTDWNTENVTNMSNMFSESDVLTVLDLSSFDTSNVTTMRSMFANCGSLQTIYVSNAWSTEKVINVEDDGDGMLDEFEGAENDLFTECWSLVGGQGTYYGEMSSEDPDNCNDKKYAVIDKVMEVQDDGTSGEEGYLTLYEAYTLVSGPEFNSAINTLLGENHAATGIIFGAYNILRNELGGLDWNDTSASYQIVDTENAGTIRAYVITDEYGDTYVYVLSQNSSVIIANESCEAMFQNMSWMTWLGGFTGVDTRNTTNMGQMFAGCSGLDWLDLSWMETGSVQYMNALFSGCSKLYGISLDGWDTGNVTLMNSMFRECSALTSISFDEYWDMSNVTVMSYMFSDCQSLYDISGMSNWDTGKAQDMRQMFIRCPELTELDLSGWNTGEVTSMSLMFAGCSNLKTIYAGAGWNTDKVTVHSEMFNECSALVGGQGTSWAAMGTEDPEHQLDKTYAVIDSARETDGVKGYLTDADYRTNSKILLPGIEVNAALKALLEANAGVTKVQFGEASQFSDKLGFDTWDDTAWADNADAILDVARSGNISAFVAGDTVYILAKEPDYDDQYNSLIYANADCADMFRHNEGDQSEYIPSGRLTAIEGLSFLDTSMTTSMIRMFRSCTSVTSLDVSNFDTSNVTMMYHMFHFCTSLTTVDVSNWDTGALVSTTGMFARCENLSSLDVSGWNTENLIITQSMFEGCTSLTTLNLSGWNVANCTSTTAMFDGCTALTTLNLSGWKFTETTTGSMFLNCSALKTIYVDKNWDPNGIVFGFYMFDGCTSLVGGQGTSFAEEVETNPGFAKNEDYARIDTVKTDGTKGYFTYEEAYTLIPGYDFNWMLFEGYSETGLGGDLQWKVWSEDTQDYVGWKGGDIRITKIVFGSFDEYKDQLGLDSWDDVAPGLALDAEQNGNIRLHIPGYDYPYNPDEFNDNNNYDSETGEGGLTYYVLSKGSSKIIANADSSEMFCNDWGNRVDFGVMYSNASGNLMDIEGLDKLDTRYVTDMSRMFYFCDVESLDLSNFVTGSVSDMSGMFSGCSFLTSLDLSGFDTSAVTDMNNMFDYCSALETLDLSNFDTGKVTDMSHMFSNMSNLTALDVSSFDTSKVTDMSHMFSYLYVSELDISNFSTAGYPYIDGMFYGCMNALVGRHMTTIYASELWDPDKVRVDDYGYAVFYGSEMLVGGEGSTYADTAGDNSDEDYIYARIDRGETEPGLFTWVVTLAEGQTFNDKLEIILNNNTGVTKLQFGSYADYKDIVGDWDDVTDTAFFVDAAEEGGIRVFVPTGSETLYVLAYGSARMAMNQNSANMFYGSYDGEGENPDAAKDSSNWKGFSNITAINGLEIVKTGRVTDMQNMFRWCFALETVNVSAFDTKRVTNMAYMFSDCYALQSTEAAPLALNVFDTSNVTDMSYMFFKCETVEHLDLLGFDTANVESMMNMFSFCTKLTELDLDFDTGKVKNMNRMFRSCTSLTTLNVLSFDTRNVTDMGEMFLNCTALITLDISSFDTANVSNMAGMFGNCTELTTIYVSNKWTTAAVTDATTSMFDGSTKLVGGQETKYADMVSADPDGYNLVKYAVIDRAQEEGGQKGYLTEKPAYTLKIGADFNDAINDLISANSLTAPKIQFGHWLQYCMKHDFTWDDAAAVDLDENDEGTIKAFVKDGTIYVLSKGNILANTDSYQMFYNMSTLTAIEGLEHMDTSNVEDMSSMFCGCTGLTELDLSSFNTSNVTTMMYMFDGCSGLTELDLSGFDTSKVTNMNYMFTYCSGLTELNVSSFNTSKVTGMNHMFRGCSGLTELDVSGFDTSNVRVMGNMFRDCSGLTELDVTNFDTSNVTSLLSMFYGCSGLTELDVTGFNTSNATSMGYMFKDCYGLTELDVSNFVTVSVTRMDYMFDGCSGLTELDLSNFVVPGLELMYYMFNGCSGLEELDLSGFDTANVTDMSGVFSGCSSLKTIYANHTWSTINVDIENSSTDMFAGCDLLAGGLGTTLATTGNVINATYAKIDNVGDPGYLTGKYTYVQLIQGADFNSEICALFSEEVTKIHFGTFADVTASNEALAEEWNNSTAYADDGYAGAIRIVVYDGTVYVLSIDNMPIYANPDSYYMFSGNTSSASTNMIDDYLTEITGLDSVNTSWVKKMTDMFYDCSNLSVLDVSSFETSKVTTMRAMFRGCSSLTELDLSNFDTSNVTDMTNMFQHCSGLKELNVSNFDTSKVTTMQGMFANCSGLTELVVTNFDTSAVTNMYCMFYVCSNLTELDVSNFNTSKVTNMEGMFSQCSSLKTLNVSKFDTGKATTMMHMFYNCSSLKSLDVSKFNTSKVTTMQGMFSRCSSLETLDVSKFDTAKVTNMYAMFYECSSLKELNVSNFKTGNVTTMQSMFNRCSSLTELDVSNLDTANVTNMYCMFYGCSGLTELDVSNFNTGKVDTMQSMFNACSNLEFVDVSGFDTRAATNMSYMFCNCSNLTSLDLSSFATSGVETMQEMFLGCSKLKTIYVNGETWSTVAVDDSTDMFTGCSALKGGMGTTLTTTGNVVDKTYAKIDGLNGQQGYLTERAATLTTGSAFNTAVKGLSNYTAMTKIQFGTYNDFATTVGDWSASTTYVDVDKDGDGTADGLIRVFAPENSDTVYVLSEGDRKLYMNEDSSSMFASLTYLGEILGLKAVSTARVTNMSRMFYQCTGLTSLDVSGFDTANVTNMKSMFYDCESVTELDVSGFDTGNVTDMSFMFGNCAALVSLDVSGFDTADVTDMQQMFYNCNTVTVLDVSGFETINVTSMWCMFYDCRTVAVLDVSGFDTANVKNMSYMFYGCRTVTELDVSGFDTANVTNMAGMFRQCFDLTSLNVSGWDTSQVTNMFTMFYWCESLTSLDVSDLDTANVTNMSGMFSYCSQLDSLNVSGFDTANVTDMSSMFSECDRLNSLDLSSFNTAKVENMARMFMSSALVTIYVDESWSIESVTDGAGMFSSSSSLVGGAGTKYHGNNTDHTYAVIDGKDGKSGYLTEIPVYTLTTGSVFNTAINTLFTSERTTLRFGNFYNHGEANGLTWDTYEAIVDADNAGTIRVFTTADTVWVLSQDISRIAFNADSSKLLYAGTSDATYNSLRTNLKEIKGLDWVYTDGVTNMSYMFSGCNGLTALDLSGFDTGSVTNMSYMFEYCSGLTALDLSHFDTSLVKNMHGVFSGCSRLTELDLSDWDTSLVTDMGGMFHSCGSIVVLDLSSFDTSNVTNMHTMFRYSGKLKTIYVSHLWNTDNVRSSTQMFLYCSAIVGGEGTTYQGADNSVTDKTYACIDRAQTEGVLGYLTDYTATLLTGSELSSTNGGWTSSTVSKMQFGSFNDFGPANGLVWEESTAYMDVGKAGKIRRFISGDTIYILSFADSRIIANEDCSSMFSFGSHRAEYLKEIKGLERVDTSFVTNMSSMFSGNTGLTSLDLSALDTSSVTNMSSMFSGCTSLTSLDLSALDTSSVENMSYMFNGCTGLTSLDLSALNTSSATDMSYMFNGCTGLTTLNVSGLETNAVLNMKYMFYDCESLTSLDVSGFESGNVTNMSHMFALCESLTTLNVAGLETNSVTDMSSMFYWLSNLTSLDLSGFETSSVVYMNAMFQGCELLTSLDVTSFDTTSLTTMYGMFGWCKALTELDLSSFDTRNVTSIGNTFYACEKLVTIYANPNTWTTAAVTEDPLTFYYCESIVGGQGQTYVDNVWENEGIDRAHFGADGYLTAKYV